MKEGRKVKDLTLRQNGKEFPGALWTLGPSPTPAQPTHSASCFGHLRPFGRSGIFSIGPVRGQLFPGLFKMRLWSTVPGPLGWPREKPDWRMQGAGGR